jgi:hypothetical protein
MNVMSRPIQRRWTGRTSRVAGKALRFSVALWLMLQIVCTSIHLYLEPHSDGADFRSSGALAWVTAFTGDDDDDGDGDHERHSAAQHELKALRSVRLVPGQVFVTSAVQWVDVEQDCPQPQVFECSGLSPPELPRCWQFLFRAALPVRAPSLLS